MSELETSPQIQLFVRRLEQLAPGERARLRRNAGRTLGEAQKALGLFYRLLPPGVPAYEHETYFLLATLYPLADGGGKGDLGTALRRARLVTRGAPGLDRRVEILLDAERSQLPFRLRQTIHFLRSNRVRVDWPQLLSDLLSWNLPSRSVQQRWARAYFSSQEQ
jgi:CRISPR system Cascade subunit CasB